MNTIVLQIAILFFPGLIWERIHSTYVLKDKPEQFDIIRRAFVFSMLSYLITFVCYLAVGHKFSWVSFSGDHIEFNSKVAREIIYATLIAFVTSIAHVAFDSYKVFSNVMRRLRATKRYGTEDVWDYVLSLRDQNLAYVNIRDFEKEIIYSGFIELFSESEKLRELVLSQAIVYAFDGSVLFRSPLVYIARDKDDIDMEFPAVPAVLAPAPPADEEVPHG